MSSTRRHTRYQTEKRYPLAEDTPEPERDRFNFRLSLSNARDRELAQYLERDLANGANVSALIKRELWRFYKGYAHQGRSHQPETGQREDKHTDGPVAVEDDMALADKLAGALDDMEAA